MENINAVAEDLANAVWKGSGRVELTEMLEQLLADRGFAVDRPEVLDDFDKLKKLVVRRLSRKISDADANGLKPRYRFAEFDADYLLPLTDVAQDEIRSQVMAALVGLSWRAFERLCAAVLTIDGVQTATASGSKEEGIDVFGLVNLRDLSSSDFWHGAMLRIAGQSKKGKITEPMVRLFARDLETLRMGHGRGYAQSPTWFKNTVAPIFGIMFTTATVAQTAKSWAENNGIILRNGHQIVEALMRGKESVKGFNCRQDQLTFDTDSFVESFEQCPRS